MKRKIFSKLLMGAFLIASVSSFVSCKDYDDDINNLQDQINKVALQSSLEALQQKVEANAATAAQAAAQALQAAKDAATAAALDDAALQQAIEAVKATAAINSENAAKALTAIADLQAAVAKAQAAADAAAADAAKDNAALKAEIQAEIEKAKSDLNAAIAAAQVAAQEAAAKAQATADAAKADAAAAQATAEKAQATAQSAETTAASALATAQGIKDVATQALSVAEKAQAAAEKAQATADAAATKDELKAAKDELTEKAEELSKKLGDLNTYIGKVEAMFVNYATKAELAEEVEKLNKKLGELDGKFADYSTTLEMNEAISEAIKDLQDKAAVAKAISDALADYSANLANNAVGTYVADELSKLKSELAEAMGVEDVAGIQGKFESWEAAMSDFLTAITSVELFYWDEDYLGRLDHQDLQFFWAEEVSTWKFGMDLNFGEENVTVTNTQMTDKTIDFTKNLVNISKDSVVIRVVPIKAELTADMVCLVNTQGDTISSDFIKVCKPYRLTEKLYRNNQTRAATDIEVGGLWIVPFEVNKEKFTAEIAASNAVIDKTKGDKPYAASFNKEWSDAEKSEGKVYNDMKSYLYAVAIKTHQGEEEANSRRLITQHDLTLKPVMAVHAPDYFEVMTQQAAKKDNKVVVNKVWYPITDARNRYTQTEMEKTYTTKVPEYNYMAAADADKQLYNYTGWWPAYAPEHMFVNKTITSRGAKPSINVDPRNDDRQDGDLVILDLDVDNQITIDFSTGRTDDGANDTYASEKRIKAFYVTLDADFALESKSSELQAWSTYIYTNSANEKTVAIYDVANQPIEKSGKMFEGETGVIVFNVPEEKKAALAGEIIGFRVYAVNYDGTVVNPDGRAFYVQIKKPEAPTIAPDEVNVTVKATKETGDVSNFVEIPAAFRNKFSSAGHYKDGAGRVLSTTLYFENGDDEYRVVAKTFNPGKGTNETKSEDYFEGDGWTGLAKDYAHVQPTDLPFQVTLWDGNGKDAKEVDDLSAAKYLKVKIDAERLLDDKTYTVAFDVYDAQNNYQQLSVFDKVAQLNVNVVKTVDAGELPEWFGVKPEAVAADGKIHICLIPSRTNGANADQTHTNYYGAGPIDATTEFIANVGRYQVSEVLKGAKAPENNIVLSFNNADAFDNLDIQVLNAKTKNWKTNDTDNDAPGVSTFIYNTRLNGHYDDEFVWSANEWSQWGTTEYLHVFSNPKAAVDKVAENAAKAVEAAEAAGIELTLAQATAIEYQKIRNAWPAKDTEMSVDAYYDNADGPMISRTIENTVIEGSQDMEVKETLYTAAHSVKAKVAGWKTFVYSCWHHSAQFNTETLAKSCDRIWNENQGKYVLKENPKQIALSVKYGETLSNYKYFTLEASADQITANEPNKTIALSEILKHVVYTNPYLTTNTGKFVDTDVITTTLDQSIASNAKLKSVSPDVAGNTYPRVVPEKGFTGTNAELANLTYYKLDGESLVKQKNVATFVNKVTEYIQYHYIDFFGHDVFIEIPFDILPE